MAVTAQAQKLTNTWSAFQSMPATLDDSNGICNAAYFNYAMCVGGYNGSAYVNTTYKTYGTVWSTEATISGIRAGAGCKQFNTFFYLFGGQSGGAGLDIYQKWNGTGWSALSSQGFAVVPITMNVIPATKTKLFMMGGATTGSASNTIDFTREMTAAESTSTTTSSSFLSYGANSFGIQSKIYKFSGITSTTDASATAINRSYNDSAWASETAVPVAQYLEASVSNNYDGKIIGGINTSSAKLTTVYNYNTNTWSTLSSIATANRLGTGAQT